MRDTLIVPQLRVFALLRYALVLALLEPRRVSRRPFGLGHAAKAWTSAWV